MKTSYLLAGLAVIIIGSVFLSSVFTNDSDESQNATTDTENTDDLIVQPQDEELGGVSADAETSAVASDTQPDADSVQHIFTLDSFNYGYSEEELRVKKGDTVTIILTNSGGFHDWVVDEFAAATEKISTGDTTTVTFVADETGTFEYYCSVGNHRQQGMVGNLIVE